MHLRTHRRHATAVCTALLVAACSRGRDNAAAQAVGDTIGAARRQAVIVPPATPYRAVAGPFTGKLSGSVVSAGAPRGDTLVLVPPDQNGCGKPLTIRRLQRSRDGGVAGALVWITDIRAGKPLPLARRFELENADCAWDPRVQATVTGGTLNVQNFDPLVERAFAVDVASGDTVAIAPFTDDGQVIPYDALLRVPGLYEWSVESRPMSRAWVAVFDDPYFAVTGPDGTFTIDSVPPGVHRIRVWHPMLGMADGTVSVPPGGTGTARITFR